MGTGAERGHPRGGSRSVHRAQDGPSCWKRWTTIRQHQGQETVSTAAAVNAGALPLVDGPVGRASVYATDKRFILLIECKCRNLFYQNRDMWQRSGAVRCAKCYHFIQFDSCLVTTQRDPADRRPAFKEYQA